ncbi:MAG: hypothetical protein H6626_03395 [Pseudobdellovibrionaceae bacterium]|nr:hypothetical protein [Bdellovibrionales bacterium]USN48146.1 MAG: hypothetical protein H6626_03395 [Pseudobdellovibrionaceae bacterium]
MRSIYRMGLVIVGIGVLLFAYNNCDQNQGTIPISSQGSLCESGTCGGVASQLSLTLSDTRDLYVDSSSSQMSLQGSCSDGGFLQNRIDWYLLAQTASGFVPVDSKENVGRCVGSVFRIDVQLKCPGLRSGDNCEYSPQAFILQVNIVGIGGADQLFDNFPASANSLYVVPSGY